VFAWRRPKAAADAGKGAEAVEERRPRGERNGGSCDRCSKRRSGASAANGGRPSRAPAAMLRRSARRPVSAGGSRRCHRARRASVPAACRARRARDSSGSEPRRSRPPRGRRQRRYGSSTSDSSSSWKTVPSAMVRSHASAPHAPRRTRPDDRAGDATLRGYESAIVSFSPRWLLRAEVICTTASAPTVCRRRTEPRPPPHTARTRPLRRKPDRR